MEAIKIVSSRDPALRIAAFSFIGPGNQHDEFSVAAKLQKWIQRNISWQRDPIGQETVSFPFWTLKYRFGDCDDQALLLSSLLESVGIKTRFRIVGNKGFQHILTEAFIKDYNTNMNKWTPLETIFENFPPGAMMPAKNSKYIKVV